MIAVVAASCGGTGNNGNPGSGGAGGSHSSSSGNGGAAGSTGDGIFTDGGIPSDDGGPCPTATTCAEQKANCGPISDGCGSILQCGDCPDGETCGGAGVPSQCGKPLCTPKTCADLGYNCGPAGDGCGNQLDCGTCTAPETCGGAGVPSQCGKPNGMCVPKTCPDQGIGCGPAGDGCGNVIDCGGCPAGTTCGGGGVPGQCGSPPCTPKTCADLGYNCGPAGDGCGGLIQCGTCNAPQTCGGANMPNTCGTPASCTNLCLKQVTCPNNGTTSVSGKVYAPNGVDPLPNVLVYVPNGTVQPFTPGVSCDNCGSSVSGSPLVSDVTGVDGSFKLTNMPVGTNIPLVIQIGRWRRQITIPNVAQCVDTPLAAATTRLPKNKTEGDIPLMAFATGSVDALECVMRKIGIDDSEFTKPTGTGRIHIYLGSGSAGASAGNNTPSQTTLVNTQATLNKYDIVLFPCQGDQYIQTTANKQNLINYLNAGGRLFATHYSYVWLYDIMPFSSTALWNVDQSNIVNDPQTGYIDTSFPKGQLLAQWLQVVGASATYGQIQVGTLREDLDGVVPPSQLWISINDPGAGTVPMHYTFNTPVGAAPDQQCGRVVYDDFHVEDAYSAGLVFPKECTAGAMTPQEKLLEFMMFDLASCVTPDIPSCTPKTCADLGINCGPAGDGCGNVINCGTCPAGQTCGGGGVPSVCGAPSCTPKTCAQLGYNCGPAGDGCGNLLDCGMCPAGQTCGGGGKPGVCGNQMCTPKTCAQQNINCGPAGDGCGNLLNCGVCPAGQTCGGGGVPGQCGVPLCVPKTCADLGFNCGPAGDGCGKLLDCGTCMLPETCGGGGKTGVCGGGSPPH